MRVTLSPTVRTFGTTSPDAHQEPGPGAAPIADDPPGVSLHAAPPAPDCLDGAAPSSPNAGGETLDPALQAWLQPLAAAAGAPPPALFGALAMTSGSGATDVFADRDALAGLARASLCAAPPPAPPASSGGLRMAIEAVGVGVSDPYGDGRVQLRFDPRFANCDPVVIALDQEQALALMRRLVAWADDVARGAGAGPPDASF